MRRVSRTAAVLSCCLLMLLGAAAVPVVHMVRYYQLPVYEWEADNRFTNGADHYRPSPGMGVRYHQEGSPLWNGRTIGRFKDDRLFGFKTWISELQGADSRYVILHGLMLEEVYERVDP
ncbi:hypothetical protein [Gorillibacterium sp. sgz5001074]|uniref:hypothetical protein n=1 Tax=Gorillibacterium sp. sgz5001074 TaxID=3446695 RepID=UPI003F667317